MIRRERGDLARPYGLVLTNWEYDPRTLVVRRRLLRPLCDDLHRKMVLLSGPRQVGKTTLARQVLEHLTPQDPVYLNWDRAEHRRAIRDLTRSRHSPVAVLDEIHQFPRWKTLVKGFHDTEGDRQRLLITGSSRLEVYRKEGDSMAGRCAGYRLHPLTIGEMLREGNDPAPDALSEAATWGSAAGAPDDLLDSLPALGGFPEPSLGSSERAARRWRLARRDQVLRQDLRDLTLVRQLALVEHLVDLPAERVGSPASLLSLSEVLEVDHKGSSGIVCQ